MKIKKTETNRPTAASKPVSKAESGSTKPNYYKQLDSWSRAKVYLSAMLSICVDLSLLIAAFSYLITIITAGSVSDPISFMGYCLGILIFMVPMFMTLYFGINIIRSYSKEGALVELKTRPGKLIKLTLASIAAVYVLSFLTVCLMGANSDANIFVQPLLINIFPLILIIVLLIILIIVKLLLGKVKL